MNFYKESAKILKLLQDKKGTLKNLIYASKYANKKKLKAFMLGVVKMVPVLEEIKHNKSEKSYKCQTVDETDEDTEIQSQLLLVSLFEYFFGASNQLPEHLKADIQNNENYEKSLAKIRKKWKTNNNLHLLSKISKQHTSYYLPRYVRVNTIKTTIDHVIDQLTNEGYEHIDNDYDGDYNRYLEKVKGLEEGVFMRDPHVPDLLVFLHGTTLHESELFLRGDILLQDKASCMAALALNPVEGSEVLDACAAPGNKTSYLAALMHNKGTIHAFDMDACRFKLMQDMLAKAGVGIVEGRNEDFLAVFPGAPPFNQVRYILVDPSCSGSGIVDRQDIHQSEADRQENHEKRIKSLSNFQAMTLNHALNFPKVERVVYSTCSIHQQENENVVLEALTKNKNFQLENIFTSITSRGLNMPRTKGKFQHGDDAGKRYDMSKCVRLCPQTDLTNGFFIACFVRKGKVKSEMKAPKKRKIVNDTALSSAGNNTDRLIEISEISKEQCDGMKNKSFHVKNSIKNINDKTNGAKKERKLLKKKQSRQHKKPIVTL